jgi:superfamily I DNA/RNA helicase
MKTFAGIRRVRRALIVGTAGTGKTVLAVARAQQLAADGFSTLLLCYNELLGDQLSNAMRRWEAITATSFHSFAMQMIREAGLPVPATPDQRWWEEGAAKVLIEACARLDREYDAIIIDEAQDFAPEWLDALNCIKRSKIDAPTFLFADPRQDLYDRGWGSGHGGGEWDFVYELPTNMRNTRQIASKVAAAGGFCCDVDSVDGPVPLWRDCHDVRKLRSDALAMIERLIDEGFGPDSLVVLCSSPVLAQELRRHVVGPYSLGLWGGRGIPVETIARFKGLEAQAVLIVVDQGQQPEAGRLAYVGMSRARSALAVVAPPSMRKHLGWD